MSYTHKDFVNELRKLFKKAPKGTCYYMSISTEDTNSALGESTDVIIKGHRKAISTMLCNALDITRDEHSLILPLLIELATDYKRFLKEGAK